MNDAYTKALKKILTNDDPARPTARPLAEIEVDIAEISQRLKGPLSNPDRLDLVEARRELRKQLETASR